VVSTKDTKWSGEYKCERADLEVGIIGVEMQATGEEPSSAMQTEDQFTSFYEVVPVCARAPDVLQAKRERRQYQDRIAPAKDRSEQLKHAIDPQ